MICKRCGSDELSELAAEIALPFPVLNCNKPPVLIFPMVLICVHCGFSEFTVPESVLQVLAQERVLAQKK